MIAFDSIDSWFEKSFRIRQGKPVKARVAKMAKIRDAKRVNPSPRGSVKFSAGAKTQNIKSVIKKAPEVMVKITGKNNGTTTAKNHISYISRNGKIELENEAGEKLTGRAQINEWGRQMKMAQIPADGQRKEFIHVLFSMPKGTPGDQVKEAVKNFCKEEFSNRRYLMALHEDTDHTHVHVCVGTRDIDRIDEPRLSPRKNDLYRWRQGFADKLREQGIDAAASERRHRFNYRRSEKSAIRQIRAENPNASVFNRKRYENRGKKPSTEPQKEPREPRTHQKLAEEIKAAVATGKRPDNPAKNAIEASRVKHLDAWAKVAGNLEKSGDHELAQYVKELMAKGEQQPVSRNQELFDLATTQAKKKHIDHDIDR